MGPIAFELKVLSAGDYFTILCGTCNSETRNEYLGYDLNAPCFKATCRTCGISKIWKLSSAAWAGLPSKPAHS